MLRTQRNLDQIKSDLLRLVDLFEKAQKENFELKQELENLRLKKEIDRGVKMEGDKKDAQIQSTVKIKSDIKSFIIEIDECINMLKAEQ